MSTRFFYDTHYQVDKPLALLHLTLATASPAKSVPDHALARLLAKRARRGGVCGPGGVNPWEINPDAMRYWLKICHAGGLLSSQNAYGYWLMNFVWSRSFAPGPPWGALSATASDRPTRLLLLRWAWLHDAPMLAAIAWLVGRYGPCQTGVLVRQQEHYVEDALISALTAVRAASADIREQVAHRQLIAEIRGGFKYNTRRHKLMSHLSLLVETGIVSCTSGEYQLTNGVAADVLPNSLDELMQAAMRPSELGLGGRLFLCLAQKVYGVTPQQVSELTTSSWNVIREEVASFWQQVLQWDRKFLGIDALAEFFIVDSLLAERPLWPRSAWRTFLETRARYQPEELTVHVGRSGAVDYLRLTEDSQFRGTHEGVPAN